MQRLDISHPAISSTMRKIPLGFQHCCVVSITSRIQPMGSCSSIQFFGSQGTFPSFLKNVNNGFSKGYDFNATENKCIPGESLGEIIDEDDICPVECVREFKTDQEFLHILEKAKAMNSLVVVDFFRNSCGSCKYIEQGFQKLCKGSGMEKAGVIFLKHNVIDEYDEQSEVAERLRIKAVPLFHFYKDGVLLEAFATRDKERLISTILKYSTDPQDV